MMLREYLYCTEFGQASQVVKVGQEPLPELGPHEVLIENLIFSINPSDLIPVTGAYASRINLPFRLGYEGVGRVMALGNQVDSNWLGQLVLPIGGEGLYQTHIKAEDTQLIRLPEHLPLEDLTRLYINPLTAYVICYQCLPELKGKKVIVSGGHSAANHLLIQFLIRGGAQVTALTRNQVSKASLEALGCERVYLQDEFRSDKAYDIGLDSVGGIIGEKVIASLNDAGILISFGLLSGQAIGQAAFRGRPDIQVTFFHLRRFLPTMDQAARQAIFDQIIEWLVKGELTLLDRYQVVRFDQLKEDLSLLTASPKVLVKLKKEKE